MPEQFFRNTPANGGPFNMAPEDLIARLTNEPAFALEMADRLAQSQLLPEELDNPEFSLTDLFAAAAVPPAAQQAPRPQTAGTSGIGRTAQAQNFITPLFTANQGQAPLQTLGQLIGGRR